MKKIRGKNLKVEKLEQSWLSSKLSSSTIISENDPSKVKNNGFGDDGFRSEWLLTDSRCSCEQTEDNERILRQEIDKY